MVNMLRQTTNRPFTPSLWARLSVRTLVRGWVTLSIATALCAGGYALSSAHAQTANDPTLPVAYASAFTQARKMGEGTMRWFGLKLYDAQLWSEKPAGQFNFRNDRHVLELRYDKSFDGAKIAEASREQIEGQGVGNAGLWPQWQKKLTDIIPDVQKDTRLAAVYLPGKGMQLFRDGQLHAELNDPELAAAFMGIWLDTRTSEPKLRERLLGLRK